MSGGGGDEAGGGVGWWRGCGWLDLEEEPAHPHRPPARTLLDSLLDGIDDT
jgi:hypothetical protein